MAKRTKDEILLQADCFTDKTVSEKQRHTKGSLTPMPPETPQARIAVLIAAKLRETDMGIRAAAKKARVSAATLSRLARGKLVTLPDVGTLTKIAAWLGVTLNDLVGAKSSKRSTPPQTTTPEIVEVHLRADKDLPPETAEALAKMFKVLYLQATGKAT